MSKEIERIKARTLELYAQLPTHDEELRKAQTHIRDELFLMHTRLFHTITRNTHLDHSRYDYEDKFQEVQLQFLEIWWWFQYPPRYKSGASFSSYFYIRLKERAERSLNELSYSVYRSTMIQCQKLLGLEHWTQVKPDMLSKIEGNSETVHLAMRMMNRNYYTAIEDHYDLESPASFSSEDMLLSYINNPSDVRRLLISEMILRETKLTGKELEELSEIYSLPVSLLIENIDLARIELYQKLKESESIDF